ncbi:MAG: hypothetical protein ACR2HX_25245 [Pyrinomonadaceae bacterium]
MPATLALMILLVSASLASAQGGRPRPSTSNPGGPVRPSPGGLKPTPSQKAPSIREREFKILEMERERANLRTPEEEKLALAQIAEDYERIQIINNKMMGATMSAPAPDYASIADTMGEIRKRANRIRDNLRLPKADSGEPTKRSEHKQATDAAQMKAALISLDGSIMSFVKNPIFKEPGVVDVQHAARAGHDLETIIESSHAIIKDAERLRKTSAKLR